MLKLLKIFKLTRNMCILGAMMFLLVACQNGNSNEDEGTESGSAIETEDTQENGSEDEDSSEELTESEQSSEKEEGDSTKEDEEERTTEEQLGFQGRVISSIYEDYYMYWDDICVLIVTYTEHFEGEPEFGLIGYNGTENPVLFMGNTTEEGYGEYDMYCFMNNRVYKSNETVKGKLHYNSETKEFAALDKSGTWNIYTYYSNHIIWLRKETTTPAGFEPMTLTSIHCSPPPMVENIRDFIVR